MAGENGHWAAESRLFSRATGRRPAADVATRGAFAELICLPRGDDSPWYGAGVFNWIDSDQEDLCYTAVSLHGGWVLRGNFRLVGEATFAFRSDKGEYPRFGVGLVTAF